MDVTSKGIIPVDTGNAKPDDSGSENPQTSTKDRHAGLRGLSEEEYIKIIEKVRIESSERKDSIEKTTEELNSIKTKIAKDEQRKLEEKGEFKELYEKTKGELDARIAKDSSMKSIVDTIIKGESKDLGDDFLKSIEGLEADLQLSLIKQFKAAKGTQETPRVDDDNPPGGDKGKTLEEKRSEIIKILDKDPGNASASAALMHIDNEIRLSKEKK